MLNEIIRPLKRHNLMAHALDECYEMVDLCQETVKASAQSPPERDDATRDIDAAKPARPRHRCPRRTPRPSPCGPCTIPPPGVRPVCACALRSHHCALGARSPPAA